MIKLKIDHIEILVPDGTSVLKAAGKAKIVIPTMCFNETVSSHASCMVCAVKNNISGEFIPSCEVKVQDGMELLSNSPEVIEFRKDALELLLSDHLGDCEAPCRNTCPAFMDIPQMNRLIANGDFSKALEVVKEEISLPLILGYICSAPCEKACRRKQMEGAVSICQLKKFVALEDYKVDRAYFPEKLFIKNQKIGLIGTGMAGLSAAFHLMKYGYSCTLFDKNEQAGGMLFQLAEKELPGQILKAEIETLKHLGAEFRLNTRVVAEQIRNDFDAIIIATGESSKEPGIEFNAGDFSTSLQGIFACGSVVSPVKMAVKVVAQGKAAANSVHRFLSGNTPENGRKRFNSRFGKLNEAEIAEYLKESKAGERNEPATGYPAGFNREEAIAEAKRCLRCDCRKSGTCKLRTHSDKYCANQQKYKFGKRKSVRKYFQNEVLVYEPEKCIKCGLCIEIVGKQKKLTGLAYVGRGFDIFIGIPFCKSMQQAIADLAGDCIRTCPTGALSSYTGEDGLKLMSNEIN